jgi:iron(III) transport system substrate-binding protein
MTAAPARRFKTRIAVLLAFAVIASGAYGHSDQAIIDQAREEGRLVFYSGARRGAAQELLNAFEAKYPFIQTELVRASSSKLATRLEAEIQSDQVQADVFEFSLIYLTEMLEEKGEILNYESPEYTAYPEEYANPGYWGASGLSSVLILVNTNLVDEEHMPTSLADLADPWWEGKLIIDNLEVSGTGYTWLLGVVQADGWDTIEAIGANNPFITRGHSGMAQKVAAGEFAAAIEMSDFHLYTMLRDTPSVPLQGVWQSEGVPQEPWTAGILKRAPNPNAAKLFMDFLLSQQGQQLYVELMGRTSARADVPRPTFANMPDSPNYVHIVATPEERLSMRPEYVATWKELWNLRE